MLPTVKVGMLLNAPIFHDRVSQVKRSSWDAYLQSCLHEAEVHGLLALMLYCDSRAAARRTSTGMYIPLAERDDSLWRKDLIGEAEQHLSHASALGSPVRFQMEAAIESAHAFRLATGSTNWSLIVESTRDCSASVPPWGFVWATLLPCEAGGPKNAFELLSMVPFEQVASYQPYWALRGHLEAQLGSRDNAKASFLRAAGLSEDSSVRRYLIEKAGA